MSTAGCDSFNSTVVQCCNDRSDTRIAPNALLHHDHSVFPARCRLADTWPRRATITHRVPLGAAGTNRRRLEHADSSSCKPPSCILFPIWPLFSLPSASVGKQRPLLGRSEFQHDQSALRSPVVAQSLHLDGPAVQFDPVRVPQMHVAVDDQVRLARSDDLVE